MTKEEYKSKIRQWLKDDAEYNKLIEGEEVSDNDIELCLELAKDEWNSIGRQTNYNVEGIPQTGIFTLLTIAHVLEMCGTRQERNRLSYSDGGVNVNPDDKLQSFMAVATSIRNRITPLIEKYKLRLTFGFGINTNPFDISEEIKEL